MECRIKYRPIIWRTAAKDQEALKMAYITGSESCPACEEAGRKSRVEERFGFST